MTDRNQLEKDLKSEPYLSMESWSFQLQAADGDLSYLTDKQLLKIKENLDDILRTGEYRPALKDLDIMS